MLVSFFQCLRSHGVPVTIREHLDLINAVDRNLAFADQQQFYYLARTTLVKDEKHFDKFDRAMIAFWNGLESIEGLMEALIPDDWLRKEFMRQLNEEQKARIESLGGLEELIEKFRQRLAEQQGRHAGGNKWIGTGGTSPFGHGGYHPSGIRIGGPGGQGRAVKVWEKRSYRNLDDSAELQTRNLKMALRRLRQFAREGAADELDLDDTIRSTARNAGLLDVKLVPEKRNAVKVLVLFDVGGSMDAHVRVCERLFSAARSEFRHLEYFYFHNFIYESLWKDNRRRFDENLKTFDVLNKYGSDYRVIFVGDASMSPWEIVHPGGSVEHNNDEPGQVWMQRVLSHYSKAVWLNPVAEAHWQYTASIGLVQELVEGRMFPLTVKGIEAAMSELTG